MSKAPRDTQADAPSESATRGDILFYLAGGFGAITLLSFGLGFVFPETSILSSFARYLLNFLVLGGTTYLLGVRRGKINWQDMGFLPPRVEWWWLVVACVISLIFIPVRGVLGYLVTLLSETGIESLEARADVIAAGWNFSWLNLILTLLGAGLLAPIAEELYFRGLIYSWFRAQRWAFWLRVLLSSMLFGMAHIDSLAVVVSSFILGVLNAVFYEWSKSLWVPIVMHVTTNTVAVLLLYVSMALMAYLPMLGG